MTKQTAFVMIGAHRILFSSLLLSLHTPAALEILKLILWLFKHESTNFDLQVSMDGDDTG